MRHRKSGRKLNMSSSHRKAMYRNLVDSLITNGRIQTTLARAKELRVLAEKLVTMAKDGSLHSKRKALSILRTKDAFVKLFAEYGERFKERNGGYTRIIKSEVRHGDNAQMAYIEYLEDKADAKAATKKRRRRRTTKKATEAEAETTEA